MTKIQFLAFLLIANVYIFINAVQLPSYGQSIECDNNFGDCGTPEQSGGGGGGKGSVLIANTDLGDTYQHADDYDDDGIEDPSDNCPRTQNPQQLDRDGDGIGDSCDNCLSIHNPFQENADGDEFGDFCDDDIDGDQILNVYDECPFMFGNSICFEEFSVEQPRDSQMYSQPTRPSSSTSRLRNHTNEIDDKEGCNQGGGQAKGLFLIIIIAMLFLNKRKR